MIYKPSIAILLALYNGEKFIVDQIKSILHQYGVDITIFISDDGSNDKSLEIIEKNFKKHPQIIFLPFKRSGGPAKNFYYLIEEAPLLKEFDYVALADQDDIWRPVKLHRAIRKLKSTGAHGYSSGFYQFSGSINKNRFKTKFPGQTKFDYIFSSPGPGCSFVMSFSSFQLLRKAIREHSGYFHEIVYHDWAIYAFYRFTELKWIIDEQSYLLYRQHDNNVLGANSGVKALFKRVHMIRNRWYEREIAKILNLLIILGGKRFVHIFLENSRDTKNALELRREPLYSFLIFILLKFRIINPSDISNVLVDFH